MKFKALNSKETRQERGFSLPEILIVIGLTAIISILTFKTFASFSSMQSIDKDADVIVSYIQKARNQTINSRNNSEYGVHFASTTITLFEGTAYSSNTASNQTYRFSNKSVLSSMLLTGNTSNIYFEQLTGKPSATGTVTFYLSGDASTTKQIIVYGSGLAEVQ